jgi:acyl-CoA thioester hydrolase
VANFVIQSIPDQVHQCAVRIYYEDTDSGGIVYYANYLKFLERGRTEFIRALGVNQSQLLADTGLAFAVRAVTADYLKPARLDDMVAVETAVAALGRAQVTFAQSIRRGSDLLLTATVRVACLDLARGKPAAMPRDLHEKLKTHHS